MTKSHPDTLCCSVFVSAREGGRRESDRENVVCVCVCVWVSEWGSEGDSESEREREREEREREERVYLYESATCSPTHPTYLITNVTTRGYSGHPTAVARYTLQNTEQEISCQSDSSWYPSSAACMFSMLLILNSRPIYVRGKIHVFSWNYI